MFVTGLNDFFQARQRSLRIRLRVRARIHFLCVSTIQHAQYEEIERDCAGSEDNLQVAVVEGGTASQRRLLQRLDVFKASGTEANLLGNQYWRLYLLQNGVWVKIEHRDIWCAPIPNSGFDRQRSQKNLGWSSAQAAEGKGRYKFSKFLVLWLDKSRWQMDPIKHVFCRSVPTP